MKKAEKERVYLTPLSEVLRQELANPDIRAAYEAEVLRREAARTLARLRKKAGLSQTELAKRAGVAQSVIGRFESAVKQNGVTLATLVRLFEPLGTVSISIKPRKRARRTASAA